MIKLGSSQGYKDDSVDTRQWYTTSKEETTETTSSSQLDINVFDKIWPSICDKKSYQSRYRENTSTAK